ncbi:MAG: PP2C family protein-serine/threonine phosphatase [Nitrospinota bacterium]
MDNDIIVELEALKETAKKEFHDISDTEKLVNSLIDVVNRAIEISGHVAGKNKGRIFRIGVTTLNNQNILAPILVVRKAALSEKMFLDTFFLMPLQNTSLAPLLESMRGDYINDMERHMNDELAKGRVSISSQISLKEKIKANMRFPYKTGKNSGFIFFSGDTRGMFNETIFDFTQDLIHTFENVLEVCNDLDALIEWQNDSIKEKGPATENYELLRHIQKKLEPDDDEISKSKNMEFFHMCFPWEGHPSGDLLNVWDINGKKAVLIADVTGHGKEAATITIFLRGLFLRESHFNESSKRVMEKVHGQLRSFIEKRFHNPDALYATAFYGVYDPAERTFEYCNAGHLPPYLLKAGGNGNGVTGLATKNMPLAMPFEESYNEKSIRLDPGDILVLYTDGVTETADNEYELFGKERLIECVSEFAEKPISETGERVIYKLKKHAGTQPWNDDVTLLLVKIT